MWDFELLAYTRPPNFLPPLVFLLPLEEFFLLPLELVDVELFIIPPFFAPRGTANILGSRMSIKFRSYISSIRRSSLGSRSFFDPPSFFPEELEFFLLPEEFFFPPDVFLLPPEFFLPLEFFLLPEFFFPPLKGGHVSSGVGASPEGMEEGESVGASVLETVGEVDGVCVGSICSRVGAKEGRVEGSIFSRVGTKEGWVDGATDTVGSKLGNNDGAEDGDKVGGAAGHNLKGGGPKSV